MHDSETRSLKRAAIALLCLSSLRFGLPLLSDNHADDPSDVLEDLLPATRRAVAEAGQRGRPLDPDERIDPNGADEPELDRLHGIGPTVAAAIVAARDTGTVFRRPEDLLLVRGIGPASLERIRQALVFGSAPRGRRAASRGSTVATQVDVNGADVAALETLPGIGPTIAERIVSTRRERLFQSVDDLVRVPGIGPKTVDRLRSRAVVGRRPR